RETPAPGSGARQRRLFPGRGRRLSRHHRAIRAALGQGLSPRRCRRTGGQVAARSPHAPEPRTNPTSTGLVSPQSQGLRLPYRTVDSSARCLAYRKAFWGLVPSSLPQCLAKQSWHHAAEAPEAGPRTRPGPHQSLDRPRLAPHPQKGARQNAHIVLIDESGVLLNPLVSRSLAPRGQPLILRVPGGHREKVSAIAGLSLSPHARRLGLYFETYPDRHITSVQTAAFLRDLLRHLRGPVIVVWDNGPMHKGEPIRRVLADYPRLTVEWLPPYAPELNPVEHLWNHVKYGQLANFTTDDVEVLD